MILNHHLHRPIPLLKNLSKENIRRKGKTRLFTRENVLHVSVFQGLEEAGEGAMEELVGHLGGLGEDGFDLGTGIHV
jgi:hypothetical protein